MANGKITDKPVATKQSEAAEKKNAPPVRSGQAQRRQPGRQGPPQPRSRQREMAAAPSAGQDSGYMLSAMAEYRKATAAQVKSTLEAEAQKKAQRSEMLASAPKGAAKIAAGMAAGRTVAGLTGKASEKPSAGRPVSKAGPDKKNNDGAAAPSAGQDSGYMLSAMAEYRKATAAQVKSTLEAEAQKKAQRSEMLASAPKGAAKIAAGMAAGRTVAGLTGKASEKPSAGRPASKAGPDKKNNDGAARRVMAMAEDITSRDGELDFGLGY